MTGHVKRVAPGRRFGFITSADGREFFYHEDDQADEFELKCGDQVTFEVVEPQPARGARAAQVTLVSAQ